MARLALLVVLVGCGPVDNTPRPVVGSAKITNDYAESLFSLSVTPLDGGTVSLFGSERIAAGKSATSQDFTIPAASDGTIDFTVVCTSLGQNSTFTGRRKLATGSSKLALVYDYDLAVGDFRMTAGVE